MKRIATFLLSIGLLLLAFGTVMAGPLQQEGGDFNSIRGTVYEDSDGDGVCGPGTNDPLAVAGVDLTFFNGDLLLSLFTGPNGTYGLVDMGQGEWIVTVPPATDYVVTSPNHLRLNVNPTEGLVRTNIDFCVQTTAERPSTALTQEINIRSTEGLTVSIPSATDFSNQAAVIRSAISENILTNPPSEQPLDEVQEVADATSNETRPTEQEWLNYVNVFRQMGGVDTLVENAELSGGAWKHARYMVVNDKPIAHNESRSNPLYDPAGRRAAINGNIFATSQIQANHEWSTNFWVSAPFHLTPLLDPELGSVGFGRYNQGIGRFQMAAVLDVRTDIDRDDTNPQFPVMFPGDGETTWIVRHSLFEWPDPLTSCPGYHRPTGPAIVLMIGTGNQTPRVTGHKFSIDGRVLDSCSFNETNYRNPDRNAQKAGRSNLDIRDAIVILPRRPLTINNTYTVEVFVNNQVHRWSFNTAKNAAEAGVVIE